MYIHIGPVSLTYMHAYVVYIAAVDLRPQGSFDCWLYCKNDIDSRPRYGILIRHQ